jgi:hypothetical protein
MCKLCPVGQSANTLAAQSCQDIPHDQLNQYEKAIVAKRTERRLFEEAGEKEEADRRTRTSEEAEVPRTRTSEEAEVPRARDKAG